MKYELHLSKQPISLTSPKVTTDFDSLCLLYLLLEGQGHIDHFQPSFTCIICYGQKGIPYDIYYE